MSEIRRRQLEDQIINNAKVDNAAAIATTKLADGVNFILRTGTVPFTADQSLGGFKVTNLANGAGANDAVNKGQLDAAIAAVSVPFQFPIEARLASTTNIDVSNPGTSTFDGETADNNDRIFLRAQSDTTENGIWIFNGSGVAMTRATDMNSTEEFTGSMFAVTHGATYGGTLWFMTVTDDFVLDTDPVTFIALPLTPGYGASNFVTREIPTGSINGSNVTFTLANTPTAGSEHVYLNGVLMENNSGADNYTISGATITMGTAPLTGEDIHVSYRK